MIGSLTVLSFLIGILLVVCGCRRWGWRALLFSVLLALFCPILTCETDQLFSQMRVPGVAWIILAAIVLVVAAIRFTNRKRRFKRWLGERPTSLKNRMERDG